MRNDNRFKLLATMILSSFMLAACGGGGGGGSAGGSDTAATATSTTTTTATTTPTAPTTPTVVAAPSVDGFYDGMGGKDQTQTVTSVILTDNSYFQLYSKPGDPNTFSNAVFGIGTSLNGSFSSADSSDITLSGTVQGPVNLSASYTPKKTFNGTLTYPDNSTISFTTAYNAAYEGTPTLAALAGTYSGTIATADLSEALTLTVTSDGKISGPLLCECNVSALAQPLATGNAYSVLIKFNGGDHVLSGQSLTGTAYLDTASKRLFLIGLMDDSKKPVIYVGAQS